MSCMEHTCLDCGHTVFDNNPRGLCPKCGGDMRHDWDEVPDRERDDLPGDEDMEEEEETNGEVTP